MNYLIKLSKQYKQFLKTSLISKHFNSTNINQTPKYKQIPEMKPSHPELGNFPDIGKSGSLHEFTVEYHKKLGDIFSFYWAKTKVVSLGNPLYWNSIAHIFDRPPELFALFLPLIQKESTQYANGEDGKVRRKSYIEPAFSAQAIKDTYYKIIRDVLEEHMSIWTEKSKKGEKIPLHEECLSIALQIISRGIFGKITKEEVSQILKAYDDANTEIEARMGGSFPEPNSERVKKFEDSIEVFKVFVKKQTQNKDSKTSFLDYMRIETIERSISESISFLVGGFHTTGNSIFWAVYYLCKNPEKLKLLQNELSEVMGNDQVVSYEKMSKLRYLKAISNETFRLSKLAPWAARVNYDSDTIINNEYIVPRNTPMLLPLGKVLGDNQLWKDEEKFRPERYKEEGVQYKFQYSPFGFAGARVCPGRALTYSELTIVLSGLFKNFNVTLDEDKDVMIKKDFGLVTKPDKEVYAFISKNNTD